MPRMEARQAIHDALERLPPEKRTTAVANIKRLAKVSRERGVVFPLSAVEQAARRAAEVDKGGHEGMVFYKP